MSPETIRANALECLKLAQQTTGAEHKSLLLTLAHSWADLANAADRFQEYADLGIAPTVEQPEVSLERADEAPRRSIRNGALETLLFKVE